MILKYFCLEEMVWKNISKYRISNANQVVLDIVQETRVLIDLIYNCEIELAYDFLSSQTDLDLQI